MDNERSLRKDAGMDNGIKKDETLCSYLAYDNEKKHDVVILYTWENVFADGVFTYARVFDKIDYKLHSTDFRNLTRIRLRDDIEK